MIHAVIGQSGAGKTSLVRRLYLDGNVAESKKGHVAYTMSGGVALIGLYNIGERTEGTDTLSYSALPAIIEQVRELAQAGIPVVLEGDRINNERMFRFLSGLAASGESVRLTLVTCSVETSLARLRAAGSAIGESFVRATRTKSMKHYLAYGPRFQASVENTEPCAAS